MVKDKEQNSRPILGFLWFSFFIGLIALSGLIMSHSYQNQKIAELKERNQQLERTNHVTSSKLESTRDSLDAATSRDVLWLSRILYTETEKPLEMYYIAHVVKNRVETCYNGNCNYRTVALDPYEFSAFNPNRPLRDYYIQATKSSVLDPGRWAASKQIALSVYLDNHDPTGGATHFFAQVSMKNNSFPDWAYHGDQVTLANNVNENRLRVYKNVR